MRTSFFVVSTAILLIYCAAQSKNYYVSTSGSDSTGDGSLSKPWATIQTAQANVAKVISTLDKNTYTGNITINIEGGIYKGPLSLAQSDSMVGFKNNNYVIYKAMSPSQKVYIYGANVITTKWTKSTKNELNLYQTNLKSQSNANGVKIYELFVENLKSDTQRILMSKTQLLTYDYVNISAKTLRTNIKTIPNIQAIMNTNYSMNLMVLLYEHWTSSYHYVSKIDYISSSGQIIMTLHTAPSNYMNDAASGKRFYLLNNMELLNMNNQFYYNESNGDLYMLSNITLTVGDKVLFAKDIEIINVEGDGANNKVERMVFIGLHFKYSAIDFDLCLKSSCMSQSAAFLQTATVHTKYVDNIVFDMVNVTYTGGYAVWFDQGTMNAKYINGKIHDVGAGGIRIGYNGGGAVQESLLAQYVEVSNNHISDGGFVYESGCGILAQSYSFSNITNNRINKFKYTGISTGWTWSYETTAVHNNIVARNEIYNIGQYVLSDMGCIYTLGSQMNCLYDNNICHDVYSYNYGGWGTYTDQASRFEIWSNNIVYNTKCAGHHQHFGLDNLFLNNIYAYVGTDKSLHDGGVRSSQHDGGGSKCNYTTDQGACSSFTFITNIVYVNNTWGYDILSDSSHTYWKNMTLDGNVYWSIEQRANLTFPDDYTIEQWTAEGKDVQHALADPMFVDPENANFNLKLGSPAIALGFHQINTEDVGPNW